jgi:hypothetical protein
MLYGRLSCQMTKRLFVLIILSNILLSVFIPYSLTAEEEPWWNDDWAFRQEINIPINTSDEIAKYQPIDINLGFNNTCWVKNQNEHSIRVIYQEQFNFIELESQIYDLEFKDSKNLKSCNLVFLIPEEASGNEKYFVYYDGKEKAGPEYQKRVEIDESYYKYEPIQGIGFESSYFKITQGEEIIYAVNTEGTVLGDKVSQHVTRLKKDAKDILPHNTDQIASFAFVYWWLKNDDWTDISSAEKFISKQIFVDGNLMVKFGIVSESKNSLLRSTVIYKYYFCPREDKRLYTNVKHEVTNSPLPRGEEIDVAFAIISCGGIKSSTIDELNFGEIPPYLHFYSDEERVKSHPFDQYPDYTNWQAIISESDDYDLGSTPWLSVDYGESGKAHAIIFNTTNIIRSGKDERDGIELQLYEAKQIQYPGLDGSFAHLYIMRNNYEKNEPDDWILPNDYSVEYNAEYFTTENGGYPRVEKEASIYLSLIDYQPEGGEIIDEGEEEEKYNLKVVPILPRSLLFKYRISKLLFRNPQITAEILHEGESFGYCKTNRVPFTEEVKIDWKNISILRKMIFTNIPSGTYVIKIYLENAIFSDEREFIGYKIIDLKEDEKVRIFCKHQGKIKISSKNQDSNAIENVEFSLLDDGAIISSAVSNSDGNAIITAPCSLNSKYSLNTTYKGFFIDSQNVRLGRVRQYIPKKISLNFDTYDFSVDFFDSDGNIPDFNVDLSITCNQMQVPTIIYPNITTDAQYYFKALIPESYLLKIGYGLYDIIEAIKIPDISDFEIRLYDLKAIIKDNWDLPPEAPIDVTLTSKDFEKTVVLYPTKISLDEYNFSNIYPGKYTIKVSYKSYSVEKNIEIPYKENEETQIVFSALFNITTNVLNSRGEPLNDAKVIFSRGNKEIIGKSNENGNVTFNIPPGIYYCKIYSSEELIAQRKVDVFYEKEFSIVTKNEPIYPAIVIILSIVILIFAVIYSYKKKDFRFFLKILVIVLAIVSIISPWWTINGNTSNPQIETSTKLYVIPSEMTTITTNSNFTAGEVANLDEAVISVFNLLPLLLFVGIICLLLPIILKRYINKKLSFLFLIFALIIFIGIIASFSYATSEMANVTVGSFIGSGNLDISIPGEDYYMILMCNWGPGFSFYLFLGSIILLLIVILLKIKKSGLSF